MHPSRRAPRLTLSARVDGHAQYWLDVRVVDLSPSGALLETGRFLGPDSRLTLEFPADRSSLSVQARVVHCASVQPGSFRVGVRFDAVPAEKRARIREILRSRLPQERREEPRIFVGQAGQLKKEMELRVLNLSLFGGLFSVGQPLEFDSEHDFVFRLPEGDVRARGVVRHCEAWARARDAAIFRVGVEFVSLSGTDRERVLAYLEDQIQAS
jgi:hypothetical protein